MAQSYGGIREWKLVEKGGQEYQSIDITALSAYY